MGCQIPCSIQNMIMRRLFTQTQTQSGAKGRVPHLRDERGSQDEQHFLYQNVYTSIVLLLGVQIRWIGEGSGSAHTHDIVI